MSPIVRLFYDLVYKGLEKFGRYYSDYPAFVHDNKDPENLHRVRLVIPGIADNPMDAWSWPKGVFAGQTWGAHCIPPEGSMVWVSFRLGDPNHPIWTHGHFGNDDITNWSKKQQRINNFWFQSPQGNIIELDDEEGTIRITDAYGNQVQTSDKGVSVIPAEGLKIFHGSLDKGDEASAMGDTTKKVTLTHNKDLLGLISSVSDLGDSLGGMMKKIGAAVNPLIAAGILLSEAPSVLNSTTKLVKNNKTLNKSLTNLNKDINKIPSTKVFLDR